MRIGHKVVDAAWFPSAGSRGSRYEPKKLEGQYARQALEFLRWNLTCQVDTDESPTKILMAGSPDRQADDE